MRAKGLTPANYPPPTVKIVSKHHELTTPRIAPVLYRETLQRLFNPTNAQTSDERMRPRLHSGIDRCILQLSPLSHHPARFGIFVNCCSLGARAWQRTAFPGSKDHTTGPASPRGFQTSNALGAVILSAGSPVRSQVVGCLFNAKGAGPSQWAGNWKRDIKQTSDWQASNSMAGTTPESDYLHIPRKFVGSCLRNQTSSPRQSKIGTIILA